MEVFFTSPWVPPEWIKAHRLEPRGIWSARELNFTRARSAGVCAFANAVVEFARSRNDAAVVFTSHCDQLRRGFDAIAAERNLDRLFLFNLPATRHTPAAKKLYVSELERLGRFLVRMGGHLPVRDQAEGVLEEYARNRLLLAEAAGGHPAPLYAQAIAQFLWDGSVCLPAEPTRNGSKRAPVALVGGPLLAEQMEVLDVLERAGGEVVLNATEPGERNVWRRCPAEEPGGSEGAGLLESLAAEYWEHLVDVWQRPNEGLYSWLKDRLDSRGVKGIVVWHHVGCDLWRAEARSLREAFGLPVLLLDVDELESGRSRSSTRLEAFVEALR